MSVMPIYYNVPIALRRLSRFRHILGPILGLVRPLDPIFNNPCNLFKILSQRSKLQLSFKLHTLYFSF